MGRGEGLAGRCELLHSIADDVGAVRASRAALCLCVVSSAPRSWPVRDSSISLS